MDCPIPVIDGRLICFIARPRRQVKLDVAGPEPGVNYLDWIQQQLAKSESTCIVTQQVAVKPVKQEITAGAWLQHPRTIPSEHPPISPRSFAIYRNLPGLEPGDQSAKTTFEDFPQMQQCINGELPDYITRRFTSLDASQKQAIEGLAKIDNAFAVIADCFRSGKTSTAAAISAICHHGNTINRTLWTLAIVFSVHNTRPLPALTSLGTEYTWRGFSMSASGVLHCRAY
ncbi:uncharacterized protein B0I36DRAFT_355874 [Microdochium trichocladiopsis]|uniref:Uncharacterized protein n=1 Tax=Microdochium trichocladiopsis TaxID=1682393 RepID=A0A9P8XQX8_9PEZI|nr:uncharacterized protein B0I36DRAFT_355874 [Microdochium trichocladiopsis]KAH7012466.1 hypothetical protein B0I36DRAFT_355874 [Microdochium trichocladiopsis]